MSSSGTASTAGDPHHGPLAAVLAAFSGGAASTAEVRRLTRLDDDVVAAAVEHLIRMGRLERSAVDLGCAPEGCDGCPASGAGANCGTAGHADRHAHDGGTRDRGDEVGSRRLSGLHLRARR